MTSLLFHESQRMTGSWLLLLIIIPLLGFVLYRLRIKNTMTRTVSLAIVLVITFVSIIVATLKLDTLYYTDRIEYQFISVIKGPYEIVRVDTIAKMKMITYGPHEYGGWGKKGKENTTAYNASGNKGMLIFFKNGTRLMLGTQQPDTVYARVKNYYPF